MKLLQNRLITEWNGIVCSPFFNLNLVTWTYSLQEYYFRSLVRKMLGAVCVGNMLTMHNWSKVHIALYNHKCIWVTLFIWFPPPHPRLPRVVLVIHLEKNVLFHHWYILFRMETVAFAPVHNTWVVSCSTFGKHKKKKTKSFRVRCREFSPFGEFLISVGYDSQINN